MVGKKEEEAAHHRRLTPLHAAGQQDLLDSGKVVVHEPIRVVPGEVRCPRCFGKDIVVSRSRGWWDVLLRENGPGAAALPFLRKAVPRQDGRQG